MLKKIPDVVQSDGDSDSSVMSQKAVTAYVQDRIPSINIEPVLPTHNKIPTVDSEVALYLDNMFIGISPREAKLVTSQNANIRFYDKTVAIIPNATQSGLVKLYLNDDSTYQVSKMLVFESTTQKVGNKNVLFIGDSMTENLSYSSHTNWTTLTNSDFWAHSSILITLICCTKAEVAGPHIIFAITMYFSIRPMLFGMDRNSISVGICKTAELMCRTTFLSISEQMMCFVASQPGQQTKKWKKSLLRLIRL